nr:hypothetical protein [Tanacetum cinerariifolium]
MSAKRTSWNEFSSSMAFAVICLSTGRKFNFSKYIFDSLVRNVDRSTKFYMYPRFLQTIIKKQIGDLSSHTTKYSSPALTQKVFANMRRVGKGFSGVETPLFEGMIVEQQVDEGNVEVNVDDVPAVGVDAEGVVSAANDEVPTAVKEPSIPSPTPPTLPPQPLQDQPLTSQGRMIADMDADVDVTLKDVVAQDAKIDEKPAELQEVVKVVTTAKLITEVVTTASATITAAAPQITTAAAPTLTTAPNAARRRKGVVIRDPEESATPSIIVHTKAKFKDKGKGILVEEPKPLKKQAQIKQDEAYARELETKLNKNIDWDEIIDHTKEQIDEEDSRALKRLNESQEDKAAKKQKLDEEVKELKIHLHIVPNDEDDVYTEANPLARKVPVVDYEIYNEHNKPYFKIKRADGSHQLYLSFLSMLRNFDREDLEALWRLVKERFTTTKPKNFSDDFLLITLGAMFEKPDIQAQILKNQRSVHGQAKVKIWKLLESCGVQIITLTITQLILLVERRYPLTRFTLDQMLNNVRLEVKEESKVSLELLSRLQWPNLDRDVVVILTRVLSTNPYVTMFKRLADLGTLDNYRVTLNASVELDQRVYNCPTTSEVTAIWVEGNNNITAYKRSIVVYGRCEYTEQIQPHYDAMALFQEVRKPDIFLTVTCNPNWPEIQQELLDQKAQDQPDLIARVFRAKLEDLKEHLFKYNMLGIVKSHV